MVNNLHLTIGYFGYSWIYIAFFTALSTCCLYYCVAQYSLSNCWRRYARYSFYIHALSVVGIIVTLYYIILNHYFEYHYAWRHSSKDLPLHFLISCFWEGQEGSFLLWIFWQVLIGIILIKIHKTWEPYIMTVFMGAQVMLCSMLLGIKLGPITIGSNPFVLLRDAVESEIFQLAPNFIPQDGNGLNPLLQNYWMVIHPPTLFLGFAGMLVPFAFCMAGLWRRQFVAWIRPAYVWALGTLFVLGLGIIMGAYWAYETLSFGGYWSWDPVENAVYVPWLVLVAAIHTMAVANKHIKSIKVSIILVMTSFILTWYATFLTRSGILGNASVHSFTDLGLSGQLLCCLLLVIICAIIGIAKAWKHIPTSTQVLQTYTASFWMLIGTAVLCLMGFQVLLPTSIPVYNKLMGLVGIQTSVAPPADPMVFYSRYQLWFAVLLAIGSATGQVLCLKKMNQQQFIKQISVPFLVTLSLASVFILAIPIQRIAHIALLTAAIYSIVVNSYTLFQLIKKKYVTSGGAVAHIGIAMILLGILFSSSYDKVISINNSGLLYSKEFSDKINLENTLLWINSPKKIGNYTVRYAGQCVKAKNFPNYISKFFLQPTASIYQAVAKDNIVHQNHTFFKKGDTLHINPVNTYYKVIYTDKQGKSFSLYPRAQTNEEMGGLLASPAIKGYWHKDLYTHISAITDPAQKKEWQIQDTLVLKWGTQFFAGDYVAKLTNIERIFSFDKTVFNGSDIALQATITVMGKYGTYKAYPVYLIKDKMQGMVPYIIDDLGLQFILLSVHPEKKQYHIVVKTTQPDYILLKAVEKPGINILWIGFIVMLLGLVISIYYRCRKR